MNIERAGFEWWQSRFARVNELFLRDPEGDWNFLDFELIPKCVDRRDLGQEGASDTKLTALEQRPGLRLCPSYRALLQVSDGFAIFGQHVGRLLSTTEADWYRNRNPEDAQRIGEWLEAGNLLKPQYALDPAWREDVPLRSIEITEMYDACTLILNPEVTNAAREWQVWLRIVSEYPRYECLAD